MEQIEAIYSPAYKPTVITNVKQKEEVQIAVSMILDQRCSTRFDTWSVLLILDIVSNKSNNLNIPVYAPVIRNLE